MDRRVVITGSGAISPLGSSPSAVHAALVAGRSGIGPVSLFPTDGLVCAQGGEVVGFDARAHLPEGNLRPLDRIGRLVASAAAEALADSGWSFALRVEREAGLVLGTMFCGVHTIAEFDRRGMSLGPSCASPMDFANSVINAAAGQAAIWHGLRGVNSTVAGGAASGLQAVAYAAEMIAGGGAEALLAGGAEELCYEVFLGFCQAGRLCGSNGSGGAEMGERPVPFDSRRNGFALGEGAGLAMLESEASAARRGARVLGEVRGWGAAYDPSRGEDPGRGARAASRAVSRALARGGVDASKVDAVWASANGSVVGDRAEAWGLAAALDGRPVPVTALKSMLGEGLGAAGGLALVDLLETLRDGRLAGIAGLEETDQWFRLSASPESREVAVGLALACAAGMDGQVSALLIAAPEEVWQ
jgi:3-oxoacyl-[acyl-carrier-protein] synthase II